MKTNCTENQKLEQIIKEQLAANLGLEMDNRDMLKLILTYRAELERLYSIHRVQWLHPIKRT